MFGGFGLGLGRSRQSLALDTARTDVDTSYESCFGNIRAHALLQPKPDVGVPKPRQLIDAPALGILVGPDVATETEDGAVVAHVKAITIVANKRDGTPNAGKTLPLSIDVQGAAWSFTDPPGTGLATDDLGRVFVTLRRLLPVKAGEEAPDRTPVDVTVTVRLGLVSSITVVSFQAVAETLGQRAPLGALRAETVAGVVEAQRALDIDARARLSEMVETPEGGIVLRPLRYTIADARIEAEMAVRTVRLGPARERRVRLEARLLSPASAALFGQEASTGVRVRLRIAPHAGGSTDPAEPKPAAPEGG